MKEASPPLHRLRQLEKAVETMQIGVTVTDTRGIIVYVNRAEAEMHGFEAKALLGREAHTLAPHEIWKLIEERQLRGLDSWSRESVNVRKDGSQFPVFITSDVVVDVDGTPLGIVSCCQDTSERKAAEQILRETEARYALAVAAANDGIWDWDLAANTVYYSPRWLSMVGATEDEIGNGPEEWLNRVHPADHSHLTSLIDEHLAGRIPSIEDEHRIRHSDSSYRWVRCRGLALRDERGVPTRMAGSLADITDLKVLDPLTGLANRVLLFDRLSVCIARDRRRHRRTFAVLFLDVDNFKTINDTLGHLVGDQLLVALARRIEATLRPGDTVARYGGDEFIVVVEDVRTADQAERLADRIHTSLREPFVIEGKDLIVTASVGIVLSPRGECEAEDVLRDSDLAMYHAKLEGGGHSRLFDPSLRAAANKRSDLESELRTAVERGHFQVYYQPIVVIESGRVVGLEALLRWQTETHGLLLPADFLTVAEETGLIVLIGKWVLREACRQMSEWHHRYLTTPPLDISVNVSARQVVEQDFADLVRNVLCETALDPRTLLLEITESTMLRPVEQVVSTLRRIRRLGVRICIDDFGTGYSSLAYLQNLPVDILKIDQGFVQKMRSGGQGCDLVGTILQMGRDLGLGVIAEGIESDDQRSNLKALRCDLGQGFVFSTPLDRESTAHLLGSCVM